MKGLRQHPLVGIEDKAYAIWRLELLKQSEGHELDWDIKKQAVIILPGLHSCRLMLCQHNWPTKEVLIS